MKQCYFLDARELVRFDWQVGGTYLKKLDRERAQKLFSTNRKWGKSQAESLGAGLLLQYALQEYLAGAKAEGLIPVTLSQVMEDSRPAVPVLLRYGEKGKPYLRDIPLHFSLSHSDGRVICAVSDAEVGADLQYPRDMDKAKLVARFFAEEEKQKWMALPVKKQEEFFYRLWTRKEAYGKLTGEGVGKTVSKNISDTQNTMDTLDAVKYRGPEWTEYVHDGGYIAVCFGIK